MLINKKSRQREWLWAVHRLVLLLLALIAVTVNLSAPSVQVVQNVQPLLIQASAEYPDSTLSVIVQKTVLNERVESTVAKLGGTVTRDLHIINAFAAELPARAVVELAKIEGVRWISLDAPVVNSDCSPACLDNASTPNLKSIYPQAVLANRVWAETSGHLQGQGIGVAVVDSGINNHPDLANRIIVSVETSKGAHSTDDRYGHGTHVAGIIGGDGTASNGAYVGIAPRVNLINVKVTDDLGLAFTSDVVSGLQWVYDNAARYNIRVVNISLNSSTSQSYHVDAIDAAVEILWFNKIVVVASAGNHSKNSLNAPANDPFVITVGTADDRGTVTTEDDKIPSFSDWGKTIDGFHKPELVAPGVNMISALASRYAVLPLQHPDHLVPDYPAYFRMSGTSMSAPVVAGTVALMLQAQPKLTPDQVKRCLQQTISPIGKLNKVGSGEVNTYAAVHCVSDGSANTGINASHLLWSGSQPVTWGSTAWNSVNWSSVNWSSVNWSSVNWSSVNWSSEDWSQ